MSKFFPVTHNDRRLRLMRVALVAAGACLAACIAGAFLIPDLQQFLRAYLSAYLLVLGLGLGCMVVLMVYHLTGGAWGFLLRRTLEAGARTLPLLAVLFIPIGLGMAELYPWARPEAVEASKNLQHKAIYLNVPFVWGRAVLFFVLWVGCAWLLNVWSRKQDQADGPHMTERLANLSGPALVVYGLAITFASVDWVMSLQPSFHSTIFAPIIASGQLLSGFAAAIIAFTWVSDTPPVVEFVSKEALNDIGNLLFTFLIIWAYMVFFQFMLIWIANLPNEVQWYLPRSAGAWYWVVWALVVFHLIVPFFLLLLRDVKRNPPALARVAGLLLFMQLVFNYWQVQPAFPDTTLADHWMDFLMPVGLGGLWLANFLWELDRSPLLPLRDINQEAATHLHDEDVEEMAEEEEVAHA
jgi:hypothetical protein